MKKLIPIFALLISTLLALAPSAALVQPAWAQSGTPAEVLAEINAYRAANGLGPLVENIYLDIAAQNHVSWMAETGTYSHTGAGGSTYTDRALAAGYGEGQSVRVTENWARGYQMTANEVVYEMWMPSGIHNSQMLTTSYNEFGAGVALDGDGMTVYVVVFGIVTGSSIRTQPPQTTNVPNWPTNTPVPLSESIATATPGPDGALVHVVQPGEALAAIADAYEIPLADLLAQNNLTDSSVIYPDERLLIVPASGPSPTPSQIPETLAGKLDPTAQPSRTPTAGVLPTRTQAAPTQTPPPQANGWVTLFSGDTLWIGISLVSMSVFGLGLLFFSSPREK